MTPSIAMLQQNTNKHSNSWNCPDFCFCLFKNLSENQKNIFKNNFDAASDLSQKQYKSLLWMVQRFLVELEQNIDTRLVRCEQSLSATSRNKGKEI